MDVLFSVEGEASQPEIYEGGPICYGDQLVFETCASGKPAFLAIVRQKPGRRSPSMLRIEVVAPGLYPNSDYIWTIVPVVGTRKKRGDAVSFADRVRIQAFDYTGSYRNLAMSSADRRFVTAEKTPTSLSASTWFIACAAQLRKEPSGRVLPDGGFQPKLEFGKGNYVALINAACYLSVIPDHYGENHYSVSTLPDLPASGMAVWWRIHRHVPGARSWL